MKIVILAVGTRGDVQPLVALGVELKKKGIEVIFSTHFQYQQLVTQYGLDFILMPNNPIDKWQNSNKNTNKKKKLWDQIEEDAEVWLSKGMEICFNSNVDAIIFNFLYIVGPHLGEKLKIPYFPVIFEPNLPTSYYPAPNFPLQGNLGRFFNKLTYFLGSQLFWTMIKKDFNKFRKAKLNLEPINWRGPVIKMMKDRVPFICSYSKYLSKKPADWYDDIAVTGYLFLERLDNYSPIQELVNFFKNGPKPIFFDFGSFSHDLMKPKIKIIFEDIVKSGERLIFDPGKINISDYKLPKEIFKVDFTVPHQWILPRVKAIITHGGAGTIHAAVKAATPIIPISIFAAQYFWGKKLFDLGLGAPPKFIKKLNPEELLNGIKFINDNPQLIQNLNEFSSRILGEKGTKNAADKIIDYLDKHSA